MARALCVYLTDWATDRVRRQQQSNNTDPHAPTLLARRDGQRELVAACCPRARAHGVRIGMTIAHARALIPESVIIAEHEPERDERALERLAVWASARFSPSVAPEPPDALLLDITGCARLFRGETRLLRALLTGVTRLGFSCRGAVAPTFLGAWALARFADAACLVIDDRQELRAALRPLPVDALGLTPNTIQALQEVGVRSVGQIIDLPRASLPARFGPELLHALDRALGDGAIETIVPVRPVTPPRFEMLFDGPTTNFEAMNLAARRALDAIAADLARAECGARRIDLELLRAGLAPESITLLMSHPSRDADHLWKLAAPRLDKVNMGDGIEGVRAVARRVSRLAHRQMLALNDPRAHHAEPSSGDAAIAGALDAISARLGVDAALRMEPIASHLPERSSRMVPVIHAAPRSPADDAGAPPGARPPILLDTPRAVRVSLMTPEGPLLVIDGVPVRSCAGPERIEPEWWRPPQASRMHSREPRDYYRVQCADGRWLWVFRQLASGKWFIHGQWA